MKILFVELKKVASICPNKNPVVGGLFGHSN